MSVVEAEAHIKIMPDALGSVLRRRLTEGKIQVDSVPGVESGEIKVRCENMEELQDFLRAVQVGDEETVRKYIEVDDGDK